MTSGPSFIGLVGTPTKNGQSGFSFSTRSHSTLGKCNQPTPSTSIILYHTTTNQAKSSARNSNLIVQLRDPFLQTKTAFIKYFNVSRQAIPWVLVLWCKGDSFTRNRLVSRDFRVFNLSHWRFFGFGFGRSGRSGQTQPAATLQCRTC